MSDTFEINAGGYQGPNSIHTRAMHIFGRAVDEALDGDVAFSFQESVIDTGHMAADLLTMVESGELTMCYFSTSYLADRVAEFALLDLPFTFTDRNATYAVLDGNLGQHLAGLLEENTGYKLLDFWDNGFRHLTNGRHPIRQPGDCKGMTIRTLFSELHGQVFRKLGFKPKALDVKDLQEGVRSGAIVAQENPLTNTFNFGIHEHHPYITLSSHFFGAAALLCNRAAFDNWSDTQRAAVRQAAQKATAAQRSMATVEDSAMMSKLSETDVQIVKLTESERGAFAAVVAPIVEAQRKIFGNKLFAMLR